MKSIIDPVVIYRMFVLSWNNMDILKSCISLNSVQGTLGRVNLYDDKLK